MWFPIKREPSSSFLSSFLHPLCSHPFKDWNSLKPSFFFQAELPSFLSLLSHGKLPSPLINFVALLSPAHPCLFSILGTKTEHSIPGVAWEVLNGVGTSFSCRWCSSLYTGMYTFQSAAPSQADPSLGGLKVFCKHFTWLLLGTSAQ